MGCTETYSVKAFLIVDYSHLHAKENIVLWTDTQTLSDGTQLSPDVSAKNEGSARGWRKKTGQNGPANRGHSYEGSDTKLDKVQLNRRFKSTSRSEGRGNIQQSHSIYTQSRDNNNKVNKTSKTRGEVRI